MSVHVESRAARTSDQVPAAARTQAPDPGLAERLRRAKRSYTSRNVIIEQAVAIESGVSPTVGDVVLARVTSLGHHQKLESPSGRRQTMVVGDEIIVAYGNRYAPDQFEATVPADLGPCQLVAAGGIAGRVGSAHSAMKAATSLEPVGLLVDRTGTPLNLSATALPRPSGDALGDLHGESGRSAMTTIVVVGSAMNSGKTTSAAHLVQGLRAAGVRVGAAKVTGTGAGGDRWFLADSGAEPVLDFTDAGLPSTYLTAHEVLVDTWHQLLGTLRDAGCEVAVIEIADGIFQQETGRLLEDPRITGDVDGLLFATVDALSAVAGLGWLAQRGLEPMAVTGVVSSSPLASREAHRATGADVWELAHLSDPALAHSLAELLRARRAPAVAA